MSLETAFYEGSCCIELVVIAVILCPLVQMHDELITYTIIILDHRCLKPPWRRV